MLLAWLDPQLERRCLTGSRLRSACGAHLSAAQDLLMAVSASPTLRTLLTFHSVAPVVVEGSLTLAMEEVVMRTTLLSPKGEAITLRNDRHLLESVEMQALLIQELRIDGRPL